LTAKTSLQPIYEKHKTQIDFILEEVEHSYNKASIIVSWLYGGSVIGWNKFLPKQKSHTPPKEVKEFFKNLKKKAPK